MDINSLKHWQQVVDSLERDTPIPLTLMQTYDEWLQQYPNGSSIS